MRSTAILICALPFFWPATPALGDETKRGGWTPEAMLQVKQVGGVQVSPDGKSVAYVVRQAVMADEKSEFVAQIHVADAGTGKAYALTQGEISSDGPQWSPDGDQIAFLSKRSGKTQVWIIRVRGGEARQLTDAPGGVVSLRWSPDGRSIAYAATDRTPESEEQEKRAKQKDDSRVVDDLIKRDQLHVIQVENEGGKREGRALTPAGVHILGESGPGFDWSPDGKSIVFAHTPTSKADDWSRSDLSVVEVGSGSVRPLVHTGKAESSPFYSPDGRWIAYVASDDPPTWAFDSCVHVVAADGGEPRRLSESYDHRPELLGWSADGQRLFFRENRGPTTRLYALPIESEPVVIGPRDGVIAEASLNPTRTAIAFSYQTEERPTEAHFIRCNGSDSIKVSSMSGDAPTHPLGRTETIRWKGPEETEVEGLLTYPTGYEPGTKYPLLLVIHGGPAGVFTRTYIASPLVSTSGGRHATSAYPIAAFAARGYAILRCNVRGSSGYGKRFRHANLKDWGGGDYRDLMAGIDDLVNRGIADPERLGVMGWSYGGFMTAWIIGHSQRFKAASVGAGVTDLVGFAGTADIPSFLPSYFGGEPWDHPETYREHSPIAHVKGARTPTLIQHGEDDERVPIAQSYELYSALKRQGCPVTMVVYPRTHHSIQEPKLLRDAMRRNLEWFDRYLGGTQSPGNQVGARASEEQRRRAEGASPSGAATIASSGAAPGGTGVAREPQSSPSRVIVTSPSGRIQVEIEGARASTDQASPLYRISFNGRAVMLPSRLRIDLADGPALGRGSVVERITTRQISESFTQFPGKRSRVVGHAAEALVSLRDRGEPARRWELAVRVYDDGAAFRYEIPAQEGWSRLAVAGERTGIRLPTDAVAYALPLNAFTTSYETRYQKRAVAEFPRDWLVGLPLLVELPRTGWAAITEANLTDYAGMYLARDDGPGADLVSRLSPLPGEPGVAVRAPLPHRSPWRVIMIAEDPARLIESDLALCLSAPCAIADTSWIKPGKTTFPWWNGFYEEKLPFAPGLNTATAKYYIDFCAESRIPYHSLDGKDDVAWYGGPIVPYKGADITRGGEGLDLREVARYAQAKGIGLRLWMHWQAARAHMDRAFPLYRQWGIEGVMIDFMDRDDQEMVNFLRRVIKTAADNRLTVTLHGVCKPTGLERTYPNLLTSEGVLNLEYDKWDDLGCTPEHEVTIPFTRMLAGPLDFHQGSFRGVRAEEFRPRNLAPLVMGTPCRTLASYVVFQNHLSMVADYPSAYRGHPALPVLASIPATWDDTRCLMGSVGEYVVIARRARDDWWLGAMTNRRPRELAIPLGFLGSGRFRAEVYRDDLDVKYRFSESTREVDPQDVVRAALVSAGGLLVHLTPARSSR
jgi:alpha-glucosidase